MGYSGVAPVVPAPEVSISPLLPRCGSSVAGGGQIGAYSGGGGLPWLDSLVWVIIRRSIHFVYFIAEIEFEVGKAKWFCLYLFLV